VVEEEQRSRAARAAAELALVRVVGHYGELPEFVVLGGLVPELLCSGASVAHAGTTDVDVQVTRFGRRTSNRTMNESGGGSPGRPVRGRS
jgi:hypothetical protein